MSPYQIDIMLWYYCRTVDHPDIVRRPPIYQDTMDGFVGAQLLDVRVSSDARDDDLPRYVITDRGRAYCEALKSVPLPIHTWTIEWPGRYIREV